MEECLDLIVTYCIGGDDPCLGCFTPVRRVLYSLPAPHDDVILLCALCMYDKHKELCGCDRYDETFADSVARALARMDA